MTAQIPAPAARPQPSTRSGIAEFGAGNRHRQDEREERSGRACREVAADRAREERAEADDGHRAGGKPRVSRAEGPDRDEHGAYRRQADVREEASQRRTRELDQHEDGERPEGGRERRLRLPDHLVREREHRRHDDCRARGALQRCEIRHGWR